VPKRKTSDSKIGRLSARLLVLITESPGSIHIRDLHAANPTATRSEMSNAPALQGLTRCFLRFGRVQSCVRPLLMRSYKTTGLDGIRG
jgi:hypothetical protein